MLKSIVTFVGTINDIQDRRDLMLITDSFEVKIILDYLGYPAPDEAFGMEILDWLNEGDPQVVVKTKQDLLEFANQYGHTGKDIAEALKFSNLEFDPTNWDLMIHTVANFANGNALSSEILK